MNIRDVYVCVNVWHYGYVDVLWYVVVETPDTGHVYIYQ